MKALVEWIVFLGLLGVAVGGQAAEVSTRVDRETVRLDESFRLVIEIEGDVDGEPDFSKLNADFEIRNQSESQNIQIIHGQFSRLYQWTLTLIPRRVGALVIPPISVGALQTQALSVTVLERAALADSADSGPIFLEAEATPGNAYVQSQVIYRLRLYRAVETRIGRLEEPSISEGEALVERLDEDRGYETRRNGKRYTVIERRYLVTPQRSGTLVFAPLTAEAIIVDSISAGGRYQRVRAPEVRIEVRPVPPDWGGKPWLPARGISLSESWSEDPTALTAGDPVSYSITLEADGMVAELLPELAREVPVGLKQYPDRPQTENRDTGASVSGRRVERVVLMPASAGSFTLPPIRLEWWNVATHRKEVTELPARSIQVLPAAVEIAVTEPLALAPEPIRVAGVWRAASAFLGAGWLVTLALWWRRRRREPSAAMPVPRALTNTRAISAARKACRRNDPHAASRALLTWGSERWPTHPPGNLVSLGARCGGGLSRAVEILDQHIYGFESMPWNGSELAAALDKLPEVNVPGRVTTSALLPLTPPDCGFADAKIPPNV